MTGRARWAYRGDGSVSTRVEVRGPDGVEGTLRIRWSTREPGSVASLAGEIDGRTVRATMPAP